MTRTIAPRQNITQQIQYVRTRLITAADDAVEVKFDGKIPANSMIIKPMSGFQVNVAFDGTTLVDIGSTDDPNYWATAMVTTSIVFLPFDEAVTQLVTADTQPVLTATGGTVTVGSGYGIICYIPV